MGAPKKAFQKFPKSAVNSSSDDNCELQRSRAHVGPSPSLPYSISTLNLAKLEALDEVEPASAVPSRFGVLPDGVKEMNQNVSK